MCLAWLVTVCHRDFGSKVTIMAARFFTVGLPAVVGGFYLALPDLGPCHVLGFELLCGIMLCSAAVLVILYYCCFYGPKFKVMLIVWTTVAVLFILSTAAYHIGLCIATKSDIGLWYIVVVEPSATFLFYVVACLLAATGPSILYYTKQVLKING